MKLLCDEDVGTGVPNALHEVDRYARSLVGRGWGGRADVDWLAAAGQEGWLVFSYNKKMLLVPDERATIESEQVGIVFATTQLSPADALLLLLRKWKDLELLDNSQPKPFARFLDRRGVLRQQYQRFPVIG